MAVIRPKDEPPVTAPAAGDKLLLDGDTVRSILVTDFVSTLQPKDPTLTALASLDATPGLLVETAADSFAKRTLIGAAGEITVANGDGSAGNPTLSLPAALAFAGKTVSGGTFNAPAISAPTGLVKGDVGLGNVDNTSDATKNAAAVSLTNKTINASNNTISNLTTAMFAANVVDNDSALTANSSTRIPTQAAVKAYADALIAANDAMVFKGALDCSANPNYPAADRGWTYKVSVAGKIGGSLGPAVESGDMLMCITDGTPSGNHATVGAQWNIVQANLVGAVTGPTSSVSGNVPTFNGTGGTVLQDSGKALPTGSIVGTSDVQALTGKTVNGLTITTTTGTLTIAAAKALVANNSLTLSGTDGSSIAFGAGGTVAYVGNKLSAFAATTSAELAGVISDETGTGSLVFANAPVLVNPIVGTQSAGDNSTKAASTAFVQAAVTSATAGVAMIDGVAGAFTTGNGIVSTGSQIQLSPARLTLPTRQIFTSGSGTWVRPANCIHIHVRSVGGGGGGMGGGASTSGGAGGPGGDTIFGPHTAKGGFGATSVNNGGAGGSGTIGAGATGMVIPGAKGSGGPQAPSSGGYFNGGPGGSSMFGGGGGGAGAGTTGADAATNSGGGGGGGSSASGAASINHGGGGGAGGGLDFVIPSPAASYSWAVGAGGAPGTAGTGGTAGGAGGSGLIIVDEFYN